MKNAYNFFPQVAIIIVSIFLSIPFNINAQRMDILLDDILSIHDEVTFKKIVIENGFRHDPGLYEISYSYNWNMKQGNDSRASIHSYWTGHVMYFQFNSSPSHPEVQRVSEELFEQIQSQCDFHAIDKSGQLYYNCEQKKFNGFIRVKPFPSNYGYGTMYIETACCSPGSGSTWKETPCIRRIFAEDEEWLKLNAPKN